MHNVVINGKKYPVEDNAPLKESLLSAGFSFPCGGVGKCGKCRIICPELPVTDLDRRFLSANQIADGMRLACDKRVEKSVEFSCEVSEKKQNITLHSCSIAVSVTDSSIETAIVGEETVDTAFRKNPLSEFNTFGEIIAAYSVEPTALTNALRSAIGKDSIELFEAYGGAKAETMAIAAKAPYLKILAGLPLDADVTEVEQKAETDVFGLPAESLYILPSAGEFIGGEIFAESVKLKERSLLIDCEKTAALINIGENDDVAAAIWDCDYSEVGLKCIRAAVKFLTAEGAKPTVYLYGPNAYLVEDVLSDVEMNVIHREKSIESVVSALLSFRTRSRINKEKDRTSFVKLYDYEVFQRFLTE